MDISYLLDSLFDLINESEELDAEIDDIRDSIGNSFTVRMKDGSVFTISISEKNG